MKTSQLAINSISVRGSLEEKLEAFSAAGFRAVEFVLSDIKQYLASHQIEDVLQLFLENELVCIGGFECVVEAFSDAGQRAQNHAQVAGNAQLLSQLGAGTMVVGSDGPQEKLSAEETLERLAQEYAAVAKSIAETGITLCIEFNWSPVIKSLRTAAQVARRANELSGLPNVGVLFDPAHYHCTPTKFEQLTRENIALIGHVHVDDMRDIPGELSNCNSDRTLPLEGCLDLRALFGAIERGGYEGYFSIEMFSQELWDLPARDAADKMYRSLLPLCEK
jgi:4-hydroxyphenylpyruvate dioxygenase